MHKRPPRTSWQKVGGWYNATVGQEGHYYHRSLILPKVLELFRFSDTSAPSLLDVACGQGVLSRHLPPSVGYVGVDVAATLIREAKKRAVHPSHQFILADATQSLPLPLSSFSHASLILALQNIAEPAALLKNINRHLQSGAIFLLVLNHPCFRIPRQSSWGVDDKTNIQYRRVDRYLSPMHIPIQTHPAKGTDSPQTWSFHHPLADYSRWLKEAGFVIELIEEWSSDKVSEGREAKRENLSRREIPLFMAIIAHKTTDIVVR